MAVLLTDSEIATLVAQPKVMPQPFVSGVLGLKPKRGHKERDVKIRSGDQDFIVIVRESAFNPLNFSVILAVLLSGAPTPFRLRRYNGKHEHTNKLERNRFYDFHVHIATERYQDSGLREDGFAVPTAGHSDVDSAFAKMLEECGFELPPQQQQRLL
jgi:hypothetical protein